MATIERDQLTQYRGAGVPVLVRGFRNNPYRVLALASDGIAVIVTGLEKNGIIGCHSGDVFADDDRLFNAIRNEPSEDRRAGLWSKGIQLDVSQLPQIS